MSDAKVTLTDPHTGGAITVAPASVEAYTSRGWKRTEAPAKRPARKPTKK